MIGKPLNINFAKIAKSIASIIFIIIVALIAFGSVFYTVQFGSVGILTRFGKIIGEPSQPGIHVKLPFADNVHVYRTQKIIYETVDLTALQGADYSGTNADYEDIAVDTTTKDGQQISVRYTVRFSLDPAKIVNTANTLGTEQEVVEKVVKTDSRIWVRNIPRNYSALDLYTGNIDNVSDEIEGKLRPIFEANGLKLDEFGIRSINFRDDYVQTIEQKQIEREKITTEEYKAKQEEFKKQALITKSEGEAESQRLQQLSLTDLIIRKMWIEKWNGQLPSTMTGSDSTTLMLNPQ